MKAQITRDISIAFDGINVSHFTEGQQVDLQENQVERLIELGCVEAKEKELVEPTDTKVIEPEIKEKPKKKK